MSDENMFKVLLTYQAGEATVYIAGENGPDAYHKAISWVQENHPDLVASGFVVWGATPCLYSGNNTVSKPTSG